MTQFLLDTNHASAVFKGQLDLRTHPKSQPGDEFSVSLPGIGELWFMVCNSTRRQQNESRLRHVLSALFVQQFDLAAAEEFGRLKSRSRQSGRPLPDVDLQIASIALVNDLVLLTRDAHFSALLAFARLKLDDWLP